MKIIGIIVFRCFFVLMDLSVAKFNGWKQVLFYFLKNTTRLIGTSLNIAVRVDAKRAHAFFISPSSIG